MLIGKFEHLIDGDVLITDPAADTSSGNGVNNHVFRLPAYQLVQAKVWLPANKYDIVRIKDGCVRLLKDGIEPSNVSAILHGTVSSSFTRCLSLVDFSEYYSDKYFDEVNREYISFDPDSFLRLCKKNGVVLAPSFEYSLRTQIREHKYPFVSDLSGKRQIACAKMVPNNSWYMYILDLLESDDNDGCVSFPGFTALSTCGESYDIYGLYNNGGPCGAVINRVDSRIFVDE